MKRPFFVTLSGILMVLAGLLQILFGALVLAERNNAKVLADAHMDSSRATGIGIGLLIAGAISVLLAIGLLRGSGVARGIMVLVGVAQIAFGIYAVAKLGTDRRPGAIGAIAGAAISLYLLFGTEKSRAFFAKSN